jgi:hypothetical protein
MQMQLTCACGCGEVPKPGNRFIHGHTRRGVLKANRYVVEDRGYKTPCWVWQLYLKPDGYGMVRRGQVILNAHVSYWLDRNGPVPEGLELDHLCRVKACVNPDHLEPVTHQENCRRRSQSQKQ